jgi:hypothetical protein
VRAGFLDLLPCLGCTLLEGRLGLRGEFRLGRVRVCFEGRNRVGCRMLPVAVAAAAIAAATAPSAPPATAVAVTAFARSRAAFAFVVAECGVGSRFSFVANGCVLGSLILRGGAFAPLTPTPAAPPPPPSTPAGLALRVSFVGLLRCGFAARFDVGIVGYLVVIVSQAGFIRLLGSQRCRLLRCDRPGLV